MRFKGYAHSQDAEFPLSFMPTQKAFRYIMNTYATLQF